MSDQWSGPPSNEGQQPPYPQQPPQGQPSYGQPQPPYGQQQPPYGQPQQPPPGHQPPYQQPAYGQQYAPGQPPYQGQAPYGQGGPPYGQQPQYLPPNAPQGGKKGNGKLIGIIGGVVAVAAIVAVAFFVMRDGGGSASASTPEEATQSFFDAIKDRDCDAIVAVTTDSFRDGEGADKCKKSLEKEGDGEGGMLDALEAATFDVKDSKIDGDKATVAVALTLSGTPVDQTLQLVKDGSTWKVDDLAMDVGSTSEMPDVPDIPDLNLVTPPTP